MKKIVFVLLIIFAGTTSSAQYVTIPDLNFANFLSLSGYSSCITGQQLDTVCASGINKHSLLIPPTLTDITGIEYLDQLDSVIGNYSALTFLPDLPVNVKYLELSYSSGLTALPATLPNLEVMFINNCSLTSVPYLPPTLKLLNCSNNSNLSALPALPSTMENLNVSHCQFAQLPVLNGGLMELRCNYNNLTALTALPSTLLTLECKNNNLLSLPALPATLNLLLCDNNSGISSLPVLPSGIDTVYCMNCSLQNFPVMPNSLLLLNCSGNNITSFQNISDSLKILHCSNNNLTTLPALPVTLEYFNCAYNSLSSLPVLNSGLLYIYASNNSLTALPALPPALQVLDCGANALTNLPVLPFTLEHLVCPSNQLTVLPSIPGNVILMDVSYNPLPVLPALPPVIEDLNVSNCLLTSLPPLPEEMYILRLSNNTGLTCLPPVHSLYSLEYASTAITCAPGPISVTSSFPPLNSLPICDVINAGNCAVNWSIRGHVYGDFNNNCVFDGNDVLLGNVLVRLYDGGVLAQSTYTSSLGEYSFSVPNGNYIIETVSALVPFSVICPLSGQHSVTISSANLYQSGLDFYVECPSGFNVGVTSVFSNNFIRPNATINCVVAAGDMSAPIGLTCASGISGTVKVVITGPVTFLSASPGALIPAVNGDTLLYNVTDFATISWDSSFRFNLHIDSLATSLDNICFDVSVDPLTGDIVPADNFFATCFQILNSYDPNDKQVYPSGLTDTSQYWLTYTIRFQNTGTAPALNIHIKDTLDINLDETTFQLLAYSHEPMTQVVGKNLRFNFLNINLPDSTSDEPGSHGFVQYSVQRKHGLPIGTQIPNTAYIYFDFNAPVVTNTTVNEIGLAANTAIGESLLNSEFSIYPNPTDRHVYLTAADNINSPVMTIQDMQGRQIDKQSLPAGSFWTIQLPESLKAGVYFISVISEGGVETKKIVVR